MKVEHPGIILARKLKESGVTRREFATTFQIPLRTLQNVCYGIQPFPLWLCDELAKKGIGTRLNWLLRIRNWEFYQLEQKWAKVDEEYNQYASVKPKIIGFIDATVK